MTKEQGLKTLLFSLCHCEERQRRGNLLAEDRYDLKVSR